MEAATEVYQRVVEQLKTEFNVECVEDIKPIHFYRISNKLPDTITANSFSKFLKHYKAKRGSKILWLLDEYFRKRDKEMGVTRIGKLPESLARAIDQVWDGTEAHAVALSKVLHSTEDLATYRSRKERVI